MSTVRGAPRRRTPGSGRLSWLMIAPLGCGLRSMALGSLLSLGVGRTSAWRPGGLILLGLLRFAIALLRFAHPISFRVSVLAGKDAIDELPGLGIRSDQQLGHTGIADEFSVLGDGDLPANQKFLLFQVVTAIA